MNCAHTHKTALLRQARYGVVLSAFMMALSAAAYAQVVPSTALPGQVEKRFQQPPALFQSPNLVPVPGQPAPSKAAQEKLAKVKFVLKSVSIDGATVYKPEDLQFAYADMTGKNISLLDAQDIARKITALYHNDGYLLSQAIVPPQDVSGGILKIRVIEGYVSGVIIPEGVGTDSERDVLVGYADNIKAEHPVRTQTLEHYLLLINDLPGVTVSGVLQPSTTQAGAADLVINTVSKKYEGSYSFDNRGSKYIGPFQHTLSLTANSLLGNYDRTRVRLFTSSPESKQLFGAEIMHEEPIGNQGMKLSLLASHTHTQPGDSLDPLDIVGNSDLYEARLTQPFIRSRAENLVGRVQIDYHDTVTNIFKDQDFSSDRLRIARIGGTYGVTDPFQGSNLVDVQLSQGLKVFSATNGGVGRSNTVGDAGFTKFNADLSRVQQLPENFSILTAGTMQHSFNPLLADEQFALGGSEYARAFDPAELLGDQGLAGKAEVRYTDSVGKSYFDSYQLYSFYDIGRVWLINGTVDSGSTAVLSSTGVGARLSFTENFGANFEAAVPLVKPGVDQTGYRHDPRLFFSLNARF